ncbi:MAG: hypothetical protein GXP37_04955 [Chloroflexi bacterium]|nr:hypothetical protein [Chloroflexota bacterium]
MKEESPFTYRDALQFGLIAGILVIFISLVGMVVAFNERYIVAQTITLGQIIVFLPPLTLGYYGARRAKGRQGSKGLLMSLLLGLVAGAVVAGFVILGTSVNLRTVFINAAPKLFDVLTFGRESAAAAALWAIAGGGLLAVLGGVFTLLSSWLRRALVMAITSVVLIGILQELLNITFGSRNWFKPVNEFFFEQKGLSWTGAIVIFVVTVLISVWRTFYGDRPAKAMSRMSPQSQRSIQIGSLVLGGIILLLVPRFLGPYPSEILTTVGIYIIMGLGLNIVVGYAGLLDLGYVAFFAIGAYTMGILTTVGKLSTMEWSFWLALPAAVLLALMAGIILGIPVLKMRGDYLAIVTLGFGEIIRIVVLSDWLKPSIGGAQGILQIPKAHIGGYEFKGPEQVYYLVLFGIALVAFVAWRLRDARLGRAWKAVREDEDVAEAMGIHLVNTKLMAFATGAAFAGLSGAIFAAKLGSIFPHSFNLIVSINVLSLIIVGGIGSLPGVVAGAFILVGMPELLREFADYRMLMYGALLVVMMLVKPEGFVPEATHQREFHEDEEEIEADSLAAETS